VSGVDYDLLFKKLHIMLPHLDERQRRLYLAAETKDLGPEAIQVVATAVKCSPATIYRGLKELDSGEVLSERIRRPGAGRKRVEVEDENIKHALLRLVAPETRGDPECPLLWTNKSTRTLVAALKDDGFSVSSTTVGRLLRELGYSLQANVKTKEGGQHVDRDAQFRHINTKIKEHQEAGNPVISVDCKKKELVGNFKNGGREWNPEGEPVETNVHDFPIPGVGKAIPYGVYDVNRNEGFVNVGCDHETSAFAVESIRRWYATVGKQTYPEATEMVICCDGGGSNGVHRRQWKFELAGLAAEIGLTIHVLHLPPGTSKWNKIEHRLFSHISMNWRGRPLTSHEVVVNLISSTATRTGLRVRAVMDNAQYPLKVKIEDEVLLALPIVRDKFHPEWNYRVLPTRS
jgi:transposase